MASSANYDNAVQELYVTYFGRPADPNGLANFAAALASAGAPTDLVGLNSAYFTNAAVKSLIDSFGTSAESIKLYGDTSAQSGVQVFVNDVFQNLFGRLANPDGLAFWSNAILSGSVTQGDAALAIAAGAAQNTTAQGKLDAEAVVNKVAVASQFTSDLQIPQQISAYSGAAAAAVARSLLSAVSATTDPSTFAQAIGSTIYNIANPNANLSFYLTTGIDHLTGNQGNDFFNAVLDNAAGMAAGGGAATLNSGDSLIGVSASNTLILADEGVGGNFALPSGITLTNITLLQLSTHESVYDSSASNGAVDLSKSGFSTIEIYYATGTNAVKVAPGTLLSFDVSRGSVATYGGGSVAVIGDGSLQNESSPANVINGDASTKSVEVDSGWGYLIQDANFGSGKLNSITSVTAQVNYGGVTIDSDALNTLVAENETLGNAITINAAPGARSLAISLDGDIGLTIQDQTATTVSIGTVSVANSATNPASSNLNLQFASASSIGFSGSVDLSVATLYAPDATLLSLTGSADFSFSSVTLRNGANIDASASRGAVNLSLSGSVSFVGGAGTDTIAISAAPSGAITGGSAGDNEIVLSNFANASATALSQVSHFATLGIAGATSGTFDLGALSGIGTLDLHAGSGDEVFTNVPSGLHVDISNGGNVNLTLQTPDTHGATDTQSVYFGGSVAYSNLISQLTAEDASGQGVGTLDIITNLGLQTNYGLGVIVDPGLTALNLNGAATIQIETAIADSATQLTIASSAGSSADYVAGVTDANLSILAFYGGMPLNLGTVTTSATTLNVTDGNNAGVTMSGVSDSQLASATFTNNSMATLQVTAGYMPLPALTELDLNGNISMSVNGGMSHAGITINGATDNANFGFNDTQATLGAGNTDSITLGNGSHNIWLGGGLAGSTQTITLGDGAFDIVTSTQGSFTLIAGSTNGGNNTVSVSGSASVFDVTVGNGQNQINAGGSLSIDISAGSGANTVSCPGQGAVGQISFAAHTASDYVSVGTLGSNVDLTHILTISGLNNNGADAIAFIDAYGDYVTTGSMQQVVAADVGGDPSQLASWVAAAVGQGGLVPQVAHGVAWFQFSGNTYLVETSTANDAGVISAHDTVVELTGSGYTFANTSTGGLYLQLKG